MAGDPKDSQSRFYFTLEQLANSPSRKCGMDADQELQYRQRAANLIQDMGQRLHVSQLCINTAIVYMHRFYAFHSFTHFHRNSIAQAALFLSAKVEEQPRKLEHVIRVAHSCLNLDAPDPTKESYQELAQDLVFNENVLLQTLGFDVAIDHPHTHVVKTCSLVKASKELSQTSYFMASNSLHLTTMCLQYRPTVVACFCIHLACKWSRWEIPQSTEGKHWFQYVDKTVTLELLKILTDEFLHIFDRCPTRLKRLKTLNASSSGSGGSSGGIGPQNDESSGNQHHKSSSSSNSQHHHHMQSQKLSSSRPQMSSSSSRPLKMDRPSGSSGGYPLSHGTSNNDKMLQNMRPIRDTSSSNQQYAKRPSSGLPSAPMSLPQQPQKTQQQQHMNNGSLQPPPQPQKHKMHPAAVPGQGLMPPEILRKSHSSSSSSSSSSNNKHHLPPQNFSQKQQQQQHSSRPQIPNHMKPLQQQAPPSKPPPSFALLDESIIPSDSLKVSPTTTDSKSKHNSIFSPDWKDTSSSSSHSHSHSHVPHPPLNSSRTTSLPGANGNLKNNNNNNNGAHAYQKKPVLQPALLLDNHLDFIKQEKISAEPPQQLLAPTPTPPPVKETKMKRQMEEELARDSKMRRLEARLEGLPSETADIKPSRVVLPRLESDKKVPQPVANGVGIETNPDLISSLLKESLFSDNSKPTPILPTLEPPLSLSGPLLAASDPIHSDDGGHRKSEKKKKKDKHKHKDRSKERDGERKKHKKDKDRHREKSRERDHHHHHQVAAPEHLKLTISRSQLDQSGNGGGAGSIKIKIPKEKLKMASEEQPPAPALMAQRVKNAAPLKIKIPKNVIQQQQQ